MVRKWPWLSREAAFWSVFLGATWVFIAIGSWLRGEWATGVIQLGTGVVLVASTLRVSHALYNAARARAGYLEAERRANQALWLCLTLMHLTAREGPQLDPEDVQRHMQN